VIFYGPSSSTAAGLALLRVTAGYVVLAVPVRRSGTRPGIEM
jgi:hypothetical protein